MKKKLVSILTAMSLALVVLAGCANEEAETDDTSKTDSVVESDETEDTDEADEADESTEEEVEQVFDYLPEAPKAAELDESEEPGEENAGMGKEVYTIKDTEAAVVMDEYFEQLEEEDWEIAEDNRPDLIKATKDDHEVIVVAGQNEEDVLLTIVSK